MIWRLAVTSFYLSQFWPRLMLPDTPTWPIWVNKFRLLHDCIANCKENLKRNQQFALKTVFLYHSNSNYFSVRVLYFFSYVNPFPTRAFQKAIGCSKHDIIFASNTLYLSYGIICLYYASWFQWHLLVTDATKLWLAQILFPFEWYFKG